MVDFDSDNTAVVVVDMQKGFCNPDGGLYAPGSEEAVDPVVSVVDDALANQMDVVFTKDVHPEGQFDDAHYYDEFEQWGEHVVEGTEGVELVDQLRERCNEYPDQTKVVEKHTYDAFHNTELGGWLDAHGIDNLVFVGTLANVCVLHTAGSAGLRDYRPVLVEDAIGAIEDDHKDYALEHAEWLFGEVVPYSDVEL